MYIIIIIVD